jgi:hypothetical protein
MSIASNNAINPTAVNPTAVNPNAVNPTAVNPNAFNPTAFNPTALHTTAKSSSKTDEENALEEFHEFYAPFGSQKHGTRPKYVSFHEVMPAYPESDPDGHAHVVSLPDNCQPKEVDYYVRSMQYSVGGGYGSKGDVENEFFNKARMQHHKRQCQGVKACEFLDPKHLKPHTSVPTSSLTWAENAAEQHSKQGYDALYNAEVFYTAWKQKRCSFKDSRTGIQCQGKACLRSHSAGYSFGSSGRPYLGCTLSRKGETHIYVNISQYDIAYLINLFGKERTFIENLDAYGGDRVFETVLKEAAEGASETCHDVFSNMSHGNVPPSHI